MIAIKSFAIFRSSLLTVCCLFMVTCIYAACVVQSSLDLFVSFVFQWIYIIFVKKCYDLL